MVLERKERLETGIRVLGVMLDKSVAMKRNAARKRRTGEKFRKQLGRLCVRRCMSACLCLFWSINERV